ncbi:MAG: 2'-5' RNA ligase family protein [Acidobacteriaceae bacterium]|nr:2'-5' RNA ligase family protein [Acidobacteriaceae bacterium]MBV9779762.1 2'-5' RNA ligase family protein [Acidobacteriaceae bacterium]
MNGILASPPWGFFALVAYVPEPLGAFLQQMRETLPGNDRSPAHITLLPPRRLKIPVEAAVEQARAILDDFPAFNVELCRVCRFPETKFLYLDVTEGSAFIRDLHKALNTGDLYDTEEFEFQPHLTLGGPVSPAVLDAVQQQCELNWGASHCAPRLTIREIAFLWLSPGSPQSEWRQVLTHRLSPSESRSTAAAATLRSRTSTTDPQR